MTSLSIEKVAFLLPTPTDVSLQSAQHRTTSVGTTRPLLFANRVVVACLLLTIQIRHQRQTQMVRKFSREPMILIRIPARHSGTILLSQAARPELWFRLTLRFLLTI